MDICCGIVVAMRGEGRRSAWLFVGGVCWRGFVVREVGKGGGNCTLFTVLGLVYELSHIGKGLNDFSSFLSLCYSVLDTGTSYGWR